MQRDGDDKMGRIKVIGKRTGDVRINIQQDLGRITDRQEYKFSFQSLHYLPSMKLFDLIKCKSDILHR